jgi:hypothetical protein
VHCPLCFGFMPTPDGLRALFVYYRVPGTHATDALQAVTALQQALIHNVSGLQARLWCRTNEADSACGEQTWMEVYEHPCGVDALFENLLAAQVRALPPGLLGPRHTEIFTPLSAPVGDAMQGACVSEA